MNATQLGTIVSVLLLLWALGHFLNKYPRKNEESDRHWNFYRCPDDKNFGFHHGHFYSPGGLKSNVPCFSIVDGLGMMERNIARGIVPVMDRERLQVQIRESGLPEDNPQALALYVTHPRRSFDDCASTFG